MERQKLKFDKLLRCARCLNYHSVSFDMENYSLKTTSMNLDLAMQFEIGKLRDFFRERYKVEVVISESSMKVNHIEKKFTLFHENVKKIEGLVSGKDHLDVLVTACYELVEYLFDHFIRAIATKYRVGKITDFRKGIPLYYEEQEEQMRSRSLLVGNTEIIFGIYDDQELRFISFFHEIGHLLVDDVFMSEHAYNSVAIEKEATLQGLGVAAYNGFDFSSHAQAWMFSQLGTYYNTEYDASSMEISRQILINFDLPTFNSIMRAHAENKGVINLMTCKHCDRLYLDVCICPDARKDHVALQRELELAKKNSKKNK